MLLHAQKRGLLDHTDFNQLELSKSWIIVKYKPEAVQHIASTSVLLDRQKTPATPSILDGMVKVQLRKDEDPIEACNRLIETGQVIYAEPIIRDRPLTTTSDPLSGSQYYLNLIKAREAWDITKGDDDIIVGIIDTGVQLDHEDLAFNLWTNDGDPIDGVDNDNNGYIDDYRGYDFADNDNDPTSDQNSHGARVAGIAGATPDNGLGIAGIGFNTKIAALKGFQSSNGLSNGLFDAILYAADNGIQVLNLSWGSIRKPLQSEQDIINYAVLEKDVVIVAAAGNDGNKPTAEELFYPASYNNVLSVGGSDESDNKWSGSTYNYLVDLIAPASAILSTSTGNSYNSTGGYGTSFASPMVAATAGLVKDRFPQLNASQIMERIRVTTDDIYSTGTNSMYDGKLGSGRLNTLRAVSEQNVASLRANQMEVSSSNGQYIFFGDTLQLKISLTNYLKSINDPAIYISSPENDFTVSNETIFPGFMGTLKSEEITFEVILSENVPPSSLVDIRLDFTDGNYTDFQHLSIETSPDYVHFGNEKLSMTVVGDGNLGLVSYGNSEVGTGLVYDSESMMKYTGIMLATDASAVSSNIISNFTSLARDDDFKELTNYKRYRHPEADHFGYSEFIDDLHSIKIEQSTLSWNEEDFLVVRYRLVNTGTDTLSNLSFGVFSDWNIANSTQNFAAYDSVKDYLYARNHTSTLFGGTKIIGNGTVRYNALDLSDQNGNSRDLTTNFPKSLKYDFLVNERVIEAGVAGEGNDVAGLHGLTLSKLNPFEATFINVVYAAARSKNEMDQVMHRSDSLLTRFINQPRLLETISTCDGVAITIDPSTGDSYDFFKDPLGRDFIASGSSLEIGTIVRDTSVYVRNRDQSYASDIFEIRLRLFSEIADFSFSVDTLYLDNTTNTVSFNDQSQGAISWLWDFGQGTQSTLADPTVLFDSEGIYEITLTVTNQQGCSDNIMKNLVVTNRPSAPTFQDYTVCKNSNILLAHPEANSLNVYLTPLSSTPLLSGNELDLGPFTSDSIIYVSGIIEGFESEKVPVHIKVYQNQADFIILPDTTSENHQLKLIAQVDETAGFRWMVNGTPLGTEKEISIPSIIGDQHIVLEITTAEGCTLSPTKVFKVSSSSFPTSSDVVVCKGSEAVIQPGNGTYFGFYLDSQLTHLLSKGTQLTISEAGKIYVVGLDDGLPGMPIEVNIDVEEVSTEVAYTTTIIGPKNKVAFTVTANQNISSYQWFVNNELVALDDSPTLYFDNVLSEVVLLAMSEKGCTHLDTTLLDFTPPLGISASGDLLVYPNPTERFIEFQTNQLMKQVVIKDLTGRTIQIIRLKDSKIDLQGVKAGTYILTFYGPDANSELKVVIQ